MLLRYSKGIGSLFIMSGVIFNVRKEVLVNE